MKRTAIVLALGLLAAAAIVAQPMMGRGYGFAPAAPQAAPQASAIEGKLVFINQYPAVQAKDGTYLLHMPRFFFNAYNDGIKEGASVKADGYLLPTLPGQDKPAFAVTKAVINGKTYDFTTQAWGGRGMMGGAYGQNYGPRGGMMGGRGGYQNYGPNYGPRGGRW